jgi:hypothetical protein
MMIAAIWIAGTVIVAVIAAGRNRSAIGWTLLSLMTSPLLAIIAVALLPPVPGKQPSPPPVDRPTARLSAMRPVFPDAARPAPDAILARGPSSAQEIGWILGIAAALALIVWMASRPWDVYWTPSGPRHPDPAMDESPHWHDSSARLAPARLLIEIPAPDPAAAGRMLDDRALAGSRLTPLN